MNTMRNGESALRRAQLYSFFAGAFLYPHDNWLADLRDVESIANELGISISCDHLRTMALEDLQTAHRNTFGVTGSICYETEYGLPHEYRQSQEMADLAGFYRAFGFSLSGSVRERPDHVSIELEFMGILAMKEAYAVARGKQDQADISREAQEHFLQAHLGRWFRLFEQSVLRNGALEPYDWLVSAAASFISNDLRTLGVEISPVDLSTLKHTPFDPDFSCATCCLPGQSEELELHGNPS